MGGIYMDNCEEIIFKPSIINTIKKKIIQCLKSSQDIISLLG